MKARADVQRLQRLDDGLAQAGASISAAMVTMDSAAMMVWLTPTTIGPLGHRQQHLAQQLPPGRAQSTSVASTVVAEHRPDAVRGDPDRPAAPRRSGWRSWRRPGR